jgi:hypothetical protein
MPPVVVELKPGAIPISQKQYFIPRKAQVKIQKHLGRLLKYGILQPCQSSWNTPLLLIQKPETKDFRPVQDLLAINSATITLHPMPLSLYMLLGLVPAEAKFFTWLYLRHPPSLTEPAYFLPSNGKIPILERRGNLPGLDCHRVSKIHPLFLELPYHLTSKLSESTSMVAHSSST